MLLGKPLEGPTVTVEALDHVNIITADIDGTSRFFAELLGLVRRDAPPPLTPQNAQWMYDGEGRAIVHLNSVDAPRTFDRAVATGSTGALHHVALRCSGYAEMVDRLESRGLEYQPNEVAGIGLRQLFVMEPNGVLLELNFFGD
ncbi:MAG: VOC family protein [Sphingomicrobium sp.]